MKMQTSNLPLPAPVSSAACAPINPASQASQVGHGAAVVTAAVEVTADRVSVVVNDKTLIAAVGPDGGWRLAHPASGALYALGPVDPATASAHAYSEVTGAPLRHWLTREPVTFVVLGDLIEVV